MNKVQLIQALKDATDLSKSEAAAVVDIFFNGMADALAKGERVRSGGCARFLSRNTGPTLGVIQKPGRRSKSNRRSYRFLNRERNLKRGWIAEFEKFDSLDQTSKKNGICNRMLSKIISMYQHSPQNRNICYINKLLTQTSGNGN